MVLRSSHVRSPERSNFSKYGQYVFTVLPVKGASSIPRAAG